ncbi:MAG: ABC transporter ATP-binding protein/permease [Oscillospiraceae bacterium]|nr:ABC transporter ATP-binding protein/permease [Oscillospiraceae bacterium]
MKKILHYLKPYISKMTFGLFIKCVGTVMDLSLPWVLAYLIDDVVPAKSLSGIIFWGVAMLVCSALALVFNVGANRMAARVARDMTENLRHDLFFKIASLSCKQVDEKTIPSLQSRLTSDTYNVHQMVGMMQRMGVRAPILLVGGIIITLTLEPTLTLVMAATIPFVALVVWYVSKKSIPMYTGLQSAIDGLVRTVRENISGARVIKALSKTEYEKNRFEDVNSNVVDHEKKAGYTMALTNPFMNLLLNLGLTLVIIAGAFLVNQGLTQPGRIIAFLSYFVIILNAMLMVTHMFVILSKAIASGRRIADVLDTPDDMTVVPAERRETEYHVVFDRVSFSYLGCQDDLSEISFSLKRGETLGIIGLTGSGKSTIINLLMRLYDADSGEILIDGRPVNSIKQKELHTMFGVVFQDDAIFADTLARNIDFGRRLPEEQIERAAELAQASPFIKSLEEGLEHNLTSRGSNLSGGQRQRVLISRALAAEPDILILDDSSSALDYKTDSLLRGAINHHFANTTSIVIAQRISSILHADHILVLKDGKQIGYGNHENLLKSCEMYASLYELGINN